MARRRNASGSSLGDGYAFEAARRHPAYRSIAVTIPMPVPLARLRTVSYAYPTQVQMRTRNVRIPLKVRPATKFITTKVRVRVPRRLPTVSPSYVSLDRNRLTIHSKRRLRKLNETEYNRRRYQEFKERSRKARNGQLDSVKADRYGMLGEAYRRGYSIRRLADVALVARAIGGA